MLVNQLCLFNFKAKKHIYQLIKTKTPSRFSVVFGFFNKFADTLNSETINWLEAKKYGSQKSSEPKQGAQRRPAPTRTARLREAFGPSRELSHNQKEHILTHY